MSKDPNISKETFQRLLDLFPEMRLYWDENEADIIAFLETKYQDWDNPEQETTQRRCIVRSVASSSPQPA